MSFVVPSAGGVLQILPGNNVSITGTNQYPIINSSGGGGGGGGNITAGVGIGFNTVNSNTTITNTGVVELYGSNGGISILSNSGGQYTLSNTGVTLLEVNQDSGLYINATTGDLSLDYIAQFVGGNGITVSTSNFTYDHTYTFDITGVVSVLNNTSNDYYGLDFLTFDGNSQAVVLSSYIDWDYSAFSLSNSAGGKLNISPQTGDQNYYSDDDSFFYDDGYMIMTTIPLSLNANLANLGLVTYTFTIDIDESSMSFSTGKDPLQACVIYTYSDNASNVIKWTRDITSVKDGTDYLGQTHRYDTFSFQRTNWPSAFTWTVEYINVQSSGTPSFTIAWTTTLAGTGY